MTGVVGSSRDGPPRCLSTAAKSSSRKETPTTTSICCTLVRSSSSPSRPRHQSPSTRVSRRHKATDLDDDIREYALSTCSSRVTLPPLGDAQPLCIPPGAFFNEHVLYHGSSTGTLCTAVALEDSVMLKISNPMRQEMQWHEPHSAYTLVLAVFRQVRLSIPNHRVASQHLRLRLHT